ncbi:acyltransferase [Nocardia amamiensis]|uniref:Acyltransferase n=1 Tax=Nocardia amamiensis TaxID=404578 RepID=A0ABS0D074_9NOCA|nr:acyltransferase family protein [Nocardia amamiensis]MBF6302051.1 acyltransferase [Nocardia amamiensis]
MTVAASGGLLVRRPDEAPEAISRGIFRPDIEGLRAVAVLAVVLFHTNLPGVGGGFVGVDVFFVISGFLVTGILWREAAATGAVGLVRFYGARARRLLPAAGVVLVATAVGAAVLLPPLQARQVLGDAIAGALYAGNYRFALHGTDYLAGDTLPSPFQHFWSLGVEEQFYLLWPALIAVTAWFARRRRIGSAAVFPYLSVLAAVAALSLAISLIWTRTLPPWAYFSLPARAWELGTGGMIALSAGAWSRLPKSVAAPAGWIGLVLIVAACTQLNGSTPYPGTAALLPVLGTALVIVSGCVETRFGVGRGLTLRPMRAVGRVSYSWYLWHWPVLLLAPRVLGHQLGWSGSIGAVMMAGGLAMLTLWLVENPVRFAAPLRRSAARSLACGGAITAVAACLALMLLVLIPVPVGRGAAAPALTLATPATSGGDARDAAVRQLTDQTQAAVAASAEIRAVPSNLTPSLADAPGDKAGVFLDGCVRSWRDVGQAECASGDPDSATTVALVGDSHAAMWHPAFEPIAAQRHWRLETMAKVTCPLLGLPISSPYLGREYTECEQWRDQVLTRLRAERPRLIVVSMSRRYGADFGFVSYDQAWIDSLNRLVGQLRATGAAVLVLGAIPDPHTTVPACLSDHIDNAAACTPARPVAVDDAGIAAEQAAATAGGGQYADLTSLFCTTTRCPLIIGDNLVYRDDNHLTVSYARTLGPVIAALADRALADG